MIKYLDLKRINEPYEHAADEVLRSGWYLRGDYTRRFEQAYADYIGTRHCIGCGNGLDALTLILRAYKELGVIHDGDEVIVPANTYIASILAITENRLVPVLVEPSWDTLQIDDSLIEQAITPRTRALMIVHLYGRCAYTDRIGDLCRNHGLKLIEDNAQAHGTVYVAAESQHTVRPAELPQGCLPDCLVSPTGQTLVKTGSLGHAAAHSFYPTKNLGAFGDAGAVTTDDDELAALVRALGNYGSARHYVFDHLGRNSRIDEIQAAVLLAKLPDLDRANRRRCDIATRYEHEIHNSLVHLVRSPRSSVHHIFPLFSPRRDDLRQFLADHGVQTEIHYPIPPHRQRCYTAVADHPASSFVLKYPSSLPVTEQIHAQEVSIPCHQALTDDEVTQIVTLVNQFR